MQKKITLKQFVDRFSEYLYTWDYYDKKSGGFSSRLPVVGFFINMYWINKKHKLTKEYGDFLDQYKNGILDR